jgi:hypothetical protein
LISLEDVWSVDQEAREAATVLISRNRRHRINPSRIEPKNSKITAIPKS